MSKEHETSPFIRRIRKGVEKNFLEARIVFGVSVILNVTSLERTFEGESEQALGLIWIANLLSGVSIYHFYQEGREEEQK